MFDPKELHKVFRSRTKVNRSRQEEIPLATPTSRPIKGYNMARLLVDLDQQTEEYEKVRDDNGDVVLQRSFKDQVIKREVLVNLNQDIQLLEHQLTDLQKSLTKLIDKRTTIMNII